ncbi:MAG: 3-oxoacyl-ACP reductase FabG [Ktedonobacteraceae bacterium]|nr:3-oxoacyl-ACP reductase FabG [Ktedonobacteraceae bacterium]
MDFHGRVALVTGASGGIGHATATRLAEAGADLALGYAGNAQAAEALAEHIRQMGQRSVTVKGDLADPNQLLTLVDTIEAHLGSIDILISNAGVGTRLPLEAISLEEWELTINVNLRSAFLLAQRVTLGMRERGWGRIVLVSSVAAFTGGIVGPHYAASKAGLIGLMHSLAGSLAPHGVTVNAVAPALIAATGMLPGNADEERALTLRIPVGRLGRPEEVAEVILSFVANPFITGQTLLVDGGIYPR